MQLKAQNVCGILEGLKQNPCDFAVQKYLWKKEKKLFMKSAAKRIINNQTLQEVVFAL